MGIGMSLGGVVGFLIGPSGLEKEGVIGFGSVQAESKKLRLKMMSGNFNRHLSKSEMWLDDGF